MNKIGKLYLIPTSLSNKGIGETLLNKDIQIIEKLKHFIVETPKTARQHLKDINITLQDLDMQVLDEHSKRKDIDFLLEPIMEGHDMGLMSDAGCPAVADPGSLVVRECHNRGIEIIPMVGPSSLTLALMGAGMNGQSFTFLGYLPRDPEKRKMEIRKIEGQSRKRNQTQIFIEAPYRNQHMLNDLIQILNPDTDLCIAIDITGENESIKTMTIKEWRKNKPTLTDIPTIFLILAR